MNELCCGCDGGFCSRHAINKSKRKVQLCQGIAETKDHGLKYWQAWERGEMGAKAPDKPVMNPAGFGIPPEPEPLTSSIGTVLHAVILRETGKKVDCPQCSEAIDELNKMTPDQAKERKPSLVTEIRERAQQFATRTEKVLLAADAILHTGQAEKIIGGWIDEAIRDGAEPAPVKKKRRARLPVAAANPSPAGAAFRTSGTPRFVKSAQLQDDIHVLISKLPHDITALAGVARSGLSVATMISMHLHLPMLTVRQNSGDIQPTGNGWRLGGSRHVEPKGKVLIVDDTVMTGNSLKAIRPIVAQAFPNVLSAAVYVNPLAHTKPDVCAVELGWPHLLEWNLFNSVLSPNMACDFDGILCRDCPVGSDDDGPKYLEFIRNAQPLYVPRREPIPLIVTARIEKYRSETVAWLSRWKIRYKRLVMHPAATLVERNRTDIAGYKAKHFAAWAKRHRARPAPLGFIESDDRQARVIASRSGHMVICPASGRVY